MNNAVHLSKQSEAILAKLKSWQGPGRLTDAEISRIRADFIKDDDKERMKNYVYNFFGKLVTIAGGITVIGSAIAFLMGWFKL